MNFVLNHGEQGVSVTIPPECGIADGPEYHGLSLSPDRPVFPAV